MDIVDSFVQDCYPGWKRSGAQATLHAVAGVVTGSGSIRFAKGSFAAQDEAEALSEGALIYIAPGDVYTLSTESGMHLQWVVFEATQPGAPAGAPGGAEAASPPRLLRLYGLPSLAVEPGDAEEALMLLRRVVQSWRRPSARNILEAHGLLLRLLGHLISIGERRSSDADSERLALVQRVKQYLEEHVESRVTLDELSRAVGASKYHLVRVYGDVENSTPMHYFRSLKMKRARALLELTPMSIKEIALRLGYSSPTVFTRAFQAESGVTPGEYRRMIRSDAGVRQ